MSEAAEALEQVLAHVRPARSWREPATLAGVDLWQREGGDEWSYDDPPEDLALPPQVDWTEDIKRLAIAAYRDVWDWLLEDGQYYVLDWPPRAELLNAGTWSISRQECHEHDVADEACTGCRSSEEESVQIIDLWARWGWEIGVQVWALVEAPGGQVTAKPVDDEERANWFLGTTDMSPLEVEYGPHRSSPHRALLYHAAAGR